MKNHLKRLAVPRTWYMKRKESKWITRPHPGAHNLEFSVPLTVFMRRVAKVAKTSKEAKHIIHTSDVLVDGRRRHNPRIPVGLMDVVSFPKIDEHYRILLDEKGRLTSAAVSKDEAKTKLSRVESKSKVRKGKTQLNLSDGRNILVDKDSYKTGDTLQLNLPDQKILSHLKLEKGMMIYLTAGKHAGEVGTVEEISGQKLIFKTKKNENYETLKTYAFVIGKDKPLIKQLV